MGKRQQKPTAIDNLLPGNYNNPLAFHRQYYEAFLRHLARLSSVES